jgi:hypothetical protein
VHKVDDLYEIMFPQQVRKVIASSIYAASNLSKELRDGLINLPMRASWLAGTTFPVFIDKIMAEQIDNIDIGKFPYCYGENRIPRCGYPYVEYYSPEGKFHIKKNNKPEKLPKAAVHRISNSLSNILFLDYGEEFVPPNISVPFALVTYGHIRFELSFIQVGFPTHNYTGWEAEKRWNIVNDVSKEMVENIQQGKVGELKEELQEQITQEFNLKIKGD